MSEDDKTAEQSIEDSRCAINKDLEGDIRIIASQVNLTKCEAVEQAVGYYIDLYILPTKVVP
jgi:hypothetical protein